MSVSFQIFPESSGQFLIAHGLLILLVPPCFLNLHVVKLDLCLDDGLLNPLFLQRVRGEHIFTDQAREQDRQDDIVLKFMALELRILQQVTPLHQPFQSERAVFPGIVLNGLFQTEITQVDLLFKTFIMNLLMPPGLPLAASFTFNRNQPPMMNR